MAVSPSGILSLPLYYLRQSLAASTNFQTWVGVETAAAALAYIHYFGTASETRPFATIGYSDEWSREIISRGARHYFQSTGNPLALTFDADINSEHDLNDALFTFTNTVGAVMADMEALAGTGNYLAITNYRMIRPPTRCHREQRESDDSALDIWQCDWQINYDGI